ncbi:MAG: hypothetical protein R2819_03505 [Allomuricauda sp.]
MTKTYLILFTVFLNIMLFSCTPDSIAEEDVNPVACCGGDGGDIPPPPPPPGGDN